jgi:hypothetical protein
MASVNEITNSPTTNSATLPDIVVAVRNFVSGITEWIESHGLTILAALSAFQQIPSRSRAALLKMAENGWYLHSEMALQEILRIALLLDAGAFEAVETEMCDEIDAALDSISSWIAYRYPKRSAPILAALDAHKRGDYFLSTPVLLAQADGMARDKFGFQLYSKRDGVPKISKLYQEFPDNSLERAFLAPILESTPLTANESERNGCTGILNRHAILHGEYTDYGSRAISSRAVSFLSFVAWSIRPLDEP